MFERIAKALSPRSRKSIGYFFGLGRAGTIGKDFRSQAEDGYGANVQVYACVNVIASACSGITWNSYRRQGDAVQEVFEHPLLDLIRRPNPWQGQARFIRTGISQLMLSGNGYIYANGPDRGAPTELLLLRPDRMSPIVGDSIRPVAGWKYTVSGVSRTLPVEKVLHLALFNPLDDVMGMSPIESAQYSILTGNKAKNWNLALLDNGARPMGALSSETNLTDDQITRLKNEFETKYAGVQGAGKPIVLEGGMKWQEMGLSPADMSWLESQKLSAREIATAFGVAPELIGDASNRTYSNWKEARKAFYMETVLPLMDWLRDELNNWLVPMFSDPNLYIEYDKDDVDALQEDRNELWTRVTNATHLTINEKREACGYEAVDGGDVILVPLTMMPTDAVPAMGNQGGG
jgi:HK97 family phage portal protein